MTRPTSELQWRPDVVSGRAVWLLWFGAPWNYEVDWGDGTTSEQAHWSPAVKHIYSSAGTYTVTCTPDLPGGVPVRTQITARTFRAPSTPGSGLDGRMVTLTMPEVPDPVRWRVIWGDGNTSEHLGRTAEHVYPWGFGTPEVTVTDVPSRRTVAFTGPEIGPEPEPDVSVRGFYFRHLFSTSDYRRVQLRGGGLNPGETVTWYPWSQNWYRDVTADSTGEITDVIDYPIRQPDIEDSWRSFTVAHATSRSHVPYHGTHLAAGTLDVVYDIHVDGDPQKVALWVLPPQLGEHHVDFGDGQSGRYTTDTVPLRIEHRYIGAGPYDVTITCPDGTVVTGQVRGVRWLCGPCYNPHYPGTCSACWWTGNATWCEPCGDRETGAYPPVVVDNGYHPVHRLHRPDNRTGWNTCFGYGLPKGDYTFRYYTFGAAAYDKHVTIERSTRKPADGYEVWLITQDESDPGLAATFTPSEEWDGGYRGTFTVHNHSKQEVRGWHVAFVLADPAVLRDAWPHAELADLGNGWWRITSTQPIPAGTDATVNARVEPPGKTRRWPDEITASAR